MGERIEYERPAGSQCPVMRGVLVRDDPACPESATETEITESPIDGAEETSADSFEATPPFCLCSNFDMILTVDKALKPSMIFSN